MVFRLLKREPAMSNFCLSLVVMVVCLSVSMRPVSSSEIDGKKPVPKPIADSWSRPVKGLSGRLRIEMEDLKPGLRHAVVLELKNSSTRPVAVLNQPTIRVELYNTAGKPVSTSGFPMSGGIPNPQWGVLPRDAYLGFRIDMTTVGVPTRRHGKVLLALGGKQWGLKPGKYFLSATLVAEEDKDAPDGQWIGELKLPTIEVVVTDQQVSADKSKKANKSKKSDQLISALIVIEGTISRQGVGEMKAIRVVDLKKLSSLESFFPNYRKRPSSNEAAPWEAEYRVYFNFPDGKSIRLTVSHSGNPRFWDVGRGDFELKGDFNKFVASLQSAAAIKKM